MRLVPLALAAAALASAGSAAAQRPVEPYDLRGGFTVAATALQVTAPPDGEREVLVLLGRARAAGPTLVAAGITGGIGVEDGVRDLLLGPYVMVTRAFPSQYLQVGRRSRAEPYVVAGVAVYGIADVEDGTAFGGAPAVQAGLGLRLFDDEWDLRLTTLEAIVEQRVGFDEARHLHLRFGAVTGRRRPRPDPAARPVPLLPAPPDR